jgi:hypothetical protein
MVKADLICILVGTCNVTTAAAHLEVPRSDESNQEWLMAIGRGQFQIAVIWLPGIFEVPHTRSVKFPTPRR